MDNVATLSAADRQQLFAAAAAELGFDVAIVEKDFWVCWMLKRVFTLPHPPASILFKGGTSLSKAFELIRRFSEDTDLLIHRHDRGFVGPRDPIDELLSKQTRAAPFEELKTSCQHAVQQRLCEPVYSAREASSCLDNGCTVSTVLDDADTLTRHSAYKNNRQPANIGRR